MESLVIEQKMTSPAVNFNAENGLLEITGRSIPEHPVKFYQPIENWLENYLATSPSKVTLHVFLDYLNTHSTECMLLIMKALKKYANKSAANTAQVEWLFDEDDEDMESLGQDLQAITQLPFEYKAILED